jgi:hypothetical protein
MRLGHRTQIRMHTTQVAIKIMVPVAMECGGLSRLEVALENTQRKCQSLLKAMQIEDRKLYILPMKGADRTLNGNSTNIMKPEEFPSDFDEILKYTPEFYVRTEAGAMYGKWLLAHDAPIQEIVSNTNHSFKTEWYQIYVRYLQSDEVADADFFIYSH